MAKKRDYYDVLGVDPSADGAEIKRAFRDLARKYHPDVNQDDARAEERFKQANEAYAVLSDPRLRARYDRHGHSAVSGAATEDGGPVESVIDALDDLFGDFIRKRRAKKAGRDIRYTLEVAFEEAALGCKKKISIPDPRHRDPTTKPRKKHFEVTIPPGTKSGAVRMIKGEGEKGRAGGTTGDLHVIVRVRDHDIFWREGHDVWCEVPISFPQAALGALIDVPTLTGKVKMRVPEGTQSGRVFRIRQKGIHKNGQRSGPIGDQKVRVVVETPQNLTAEQRKLIEQFAAAKGEKIAHPRKRKFVDRLRELFAE